MEREDDARLIGKFLSGDDTAFGILVEKYQKSIHALAWRKIQDFHHAEEIMQDTFLRAYNKLPTLKNPNQFAGWLHVIANRLCIDWMRSQRSVTQSLEDTPTKEIEKSSYVHHISEQRMTERIEHYHELVRRLLEKLPANERSVVTLFYLDEMSTREIARVMGVSVNTITSRLQRARKRLQADQELLNPEFFGSLELPDNVKENIMTQLEEIRTKFNAFMEDVKSDPASRSDILTKACNEIEDALKGKTTPELMHLAVDEIYLYMDKFGMEKRIPLLRKYMDETSDNTERFWAHDGLIYSLAFLGRHREAIEEHSQFYRWTCQHLSDKYVLEAASNLHVHGCWAAEGRIDDWIQLYHEASERLDNPDVSCYSRCEFLQTGVDVLRCNDRFDEALLEIEKLERANNEPGSDHYSQFWLIAKENLLLIYGGQEDWERFDQIFTEVRAYMEGELKKRETGQPVDLGHLMWLAHDVGCCLVWLRKYDEAKRFLKVAIDLENNNDYAHLQLAASIWASEKDREKTLHHLKVARDYYVAQPDNWDTYYPTFLETPEFSDVKDDKEFLKVIGPQVS